MAQREVDLATHPQANDWFGSFSSKVSIWLGSRWGFSAAAVTIVIWGICGPIFKYSNTWQLIINTGTTIVTFLMVFLIQNTQNRDARAINLKLNELIYATTNAADQMMDIEKLTDIELDEIAARYEAIRAECIRRKGRVPESKEAAAAK